MPRVSAERLQSREKELVAAARSVFAAKGFENSAISDIAQAAGVSDGLLYRYFDSKRAILQAVLDDFFAGLIQNLERSVAAETDFRDRLAVMIREHVGVFIDDLNLCRLFLVEVRNFEDYFGSETHVLSRRYSSVLMRILEGGIADGQIDPLIDGRLVRDILFGGIEHLAWRHILAGQPIDAGAITDRMTSLLLFGLLGAQHR